MDKTAAIAWLNQFEHPSLAYGWADVSGIVSVQDHAISITWPFASYQLTEDFSDWLAGEQTTGKTTWEVTVSHSVKPLQSALGTDLKGVKNIIAVSSGKGGVGKSTTAVNLALALKALGAKVGVLDADIYGPSIPLMFNTQGRKPEVRDGKWMQPIESYGVYTHSIGYLVDKDEAAVWRGPMASRALGQLLNETDWPALDYLVIDMPPGTGDIQLTLAQQIPVNGALIVTTPQDLALADARKGAAMFNKVNVPVLGIAENMSYHICSKCGHKEPIFGCGGAEKMAQEYGLPVVAQFPLHIDIRNDLDSGKPTVAARPDSEHSLMYRDLAEKLVAKMYWQGTPRAESILFKQID